LNSAIIGGGHSYVLSQTVYNGAGTGALYEFGPEGIERKLYLHRIDDNEVQAVLLSDYELRKGRIKHTTQSTIHLDKLKIQYDLLKNNDANYLLRKAA